MNSDSLLRQFTIGYGLLAGMTWLSELILALTRHAHMLKSVDQYAGLFTVLAGVGIGLAWLGYGVALLIKACMEDM